MAAGEHGHGEVARVDPADLPAGTVVTPSGRVSAAEIYRDPSAADHPFSPAQLTRLDEALTLASRETGLRFSVFVGDLGDDPAAKVDELHDAPCSASSRCAPVPRPGCACPTAAASSLS